MKSFDKPYLEHLVIPHRLIATIRQIGEHKGRQELYKQQAPEMLENIMGKVAVIQSMESSNHLEATTRKVVVRRVVVVQSEMSYRGLFLLRKISWRINHVN